MANTMDRRAFLGVSGLALSGISYTGFVSPRSRAVQAAELSTPAALKIGWQTGIQQYTFRRFCFFEALDMIAELGVRHVEPAFFLSLDKNRPSLKTGDTLTAPLRQEMRDRMSDRGISMPNYYADIGNDRDAAVKAFEFSKEMGATTIVAEPPPEAFDMVEGLCNEYQINLAIHNHPKSPQSRYWNPENVQAVCKGRGPRIGACCDTGHWVRSGLKPLECLKTMAGRIITFHLKDVGVWGKPEARDVPLGTGLAEYGKVLEELKRQAFHGLLVVEYEHDSPQLKDEVAQCLAFVEKTAARLAG